MGYYVSTYYNGKAQPMRLLHREAPVSSHKQVSYCPIETITQILAILWDRRSYLSQNPYLDFYYL